MRYLTGIGRMDDRLLSFDDMVGGDSIVRIIDVIVQNFYQDNPELLAHPAKGSELTGRKAYSPISMMGLLVYSYFMGLAGSRKIEKGTYINIEIMWLMHGLRPDHWTIAAFRRQNKSAFKSIIKMFRRFLVENKYADPSKMVFDGSKMKAYANRDMLTQKGILKKLENIDTSVNKFLEAVEANDTAEKILEQTLIDTAKAAQALEELKEAKQTVEKEMRNIELERKDLKKEKEQFQKSIEKLAKKKSKLKHISEILEKTGKNYIAPNDPEAVLLKSRDGKVAGYNIQTGVDEKGHFILNSDVTTYATDQNLLNDNIDSVIEQTGVQPKEATADKGYGATEDILEAQRRGIECFVPTPETQREKQAKEGIEFIYDKETDTYTCSNGKILKLFNRNAKMSDGSLCNKYKCYECEGCPLRSKCTTSSSGRVLKRKHNEAQVQEYKESLKTAKAKEKISMRKKVVEHPFGTIKMLMGKFNFLLVGEEKVQIEIDLYSIAYNLKRLLCMGEVRLLMNKINEFNWKIV